MDWILTVTRNAYTGEVLNRQPTLSDEDRSGKRANIRARRTALQAALLKQVGPEIIQFNKKVVALEDLGKGNGARLVFRDGTKAAADLVVGADGIRSVCGKFIRTRLIVGTNCSCRSQEGRCSQIISSAILVSLKAVANRQCLLNHAHLVFSRKHGISHIAARRSDAAAQFSSRNKLVACEERSFLLLAR